MRKLVAAILISAMLISCIGCNKNTKPASSSSEATTTTTTTATTTTAPLKITEPTTTTTEKPAPDPAIQKQKADTIANAFINAFTTGDTKTINQYYKLSELKAFDFLKNVKFASQSITYMKNEGLYWFYYQVDLNIIEDKSNTLKTGKQIYTLFVNLQPDEYFQPIEFYRNNPNDMLNEQSIKLCSKYEFISDYFKGNSNADIERFYLTCISFYYYTSNLEQFTSEQLNTFIKSSFYVSDFDSSKSKYYYKIDHDFRNWQTSGEHYICKATSANMISSDKTELTIDYFADYSGFVKVKTVKYVVSNVVSENNRVLSRTVISDSNLKVLIG